jgi:tetratricopeptide (TPR) repeat protein
MDPNSRVVKLCADGMKAEAAGQSERARILFEEAWEASEDDYEACIAAHYVARHQPDRQATFRWNQEALRRADAATDDRVRGFYASLYLNLGHSYEQLGDGPTACDHYREAAARLVDVPAGPYGDIVRTGVTEGQRRTCPDALERQVG